MGTGASHTPPPQMEIRRMYENEELYKVTVTGLSMYWTLYKRRCKLGKGL
jgi:hypothetical protein